MKSHCGRVTLFSAAGAGASVTVILAAVIFLILLAFGLTGCGDPDTTRDEADDQAPVRSPEQLPLLDLEAPAAFETASFALG